MNNYILGDEYLRDSTIFVNKLVKTYLGYPYSQCYRYTHQAIKYEERSQTHCFRSCRNRYIQKDINCSLLFLNGYVHEGEYDHGKKYCENIVSNVNDLQKILNLSQSLEIHSKCKNECLQSCHQIDYDWKEVKHGFATYVIQRNVKILHDISKAPRYKMSIVWDSSKPMFKYSEHPIMTFTSYLVDCGGLMSLWFGTSANDVLTLITTAVMSKLLSLYNRIHNRNQVLPYNSNS